MKSDSLVAYYPEMACNGYTSRRWGGLRFNVIGSVENQYFNNLSARFTFSAKEKDAETGFSYFGSRYYSSDLSIWLSVDPMSNKYTHKSIYVYCSDNPVKVFDPNGKDKWEVKESTGVIKHYSNVKPDKLYVTSQDGT